MNPAGIILHGARRGLALLVAAVTVTLVLVLGGYLFRARMEQDRLDAMASISGWHSQIAQKKSDLESIGLHIEEYKDLERKGLIGPPDREGWVELFTTVYRSLGPLRGQFTYSLAPPMALGADPQAGDGTPAAPDAPLMHDLEFEINGIHEVELLRLIRDFRSKVKGQFRIERCQLGKASPTGMTAKCVLRFFTLPDDALTAGQATRSGE